MNPPKMPVHIGDYKRDTGHLRAAGHGAYLMLLFHYWSTGSLPDDDDQLSAIACMSRAEWKRMRPMIEPFFKPGWKHGRVEHELEKAATVSQAAREAGLASGRTRAQRKTNGRSSSVENSLSIRSSSVEPTLEPLNHREERKEEDTADAVPPTKSYAFSNGIIRLSASDLAKWRKAYEFLSLEAELIALTEWADQQGSRWFHAVSNALAKRNREVRARSEQNRKIVWRSGIEGVV